jgi:hypothetical protein
VTNHHRFVERKKNQYGGQVLLALKEMGSFILKASGIGTPTSPGTEMRRQKLQRADTEKTILVAACLDN